MKESEEVNVVQASDLWIHTFIYNVTPEQTQVIMRSGQWEHALKFNNDTKAKSTNSSPAPKNIVTNTLKNTILFPHFDFVYGTKS